MTLFWMLVAINCINVLMGVVIGWTFAPHLSRFFLWWDVDACIDHTLNHILYHEPAFSGIVWRIKCLPNNCPKRENLSIQYIAMQRHGYIGGDYRCMTRMAVISLPSSAYQE